MRACVLACARVHVCTHVLGKCLQGFASTDSLASGAMSERPEAMITFTFSSLAQQPLIVMKASCVYFTSLLHRYYAYTYRYLNIVAVGTKRCIYKVMIL